MATNRGLQIPVKLSVKVIDNVDVYLADFCISNDAGLTKEQASRIANKLAHIFDVEIKHLVTDKRT